MKTQICRRCGYTKDEHHKGIGWLKINGKKVCLGYMRPMKRWAFVRYILCNLGKHPKRAMILIRKEKNGIEVYWCPKCNITITVDIVKGREYLARNHM